MSYCIFSCGAESLWSDYVDVRDVVADSLFKRLYDDSIAKIVDFFRDEPVFRFYLCDEPSFDQIPSSGYVIRQLKRLGAPDGIQAIDNPDYYDYYLDTTKAEELMVDPYPFLGNALGTRLQRRTPEDSGRLFQECLDILCKRLGLARIATKSRNKSLIYIPQTFGNLVPFDEPPYEYWLDEWNDSIPLYLEGRYREPTPRELRCIIWLALAYGAKGIYHFLYNTFHISKPIYPYYYWCVGVTAPDTGNFQKRWNWDTVRLLNSEIEIASQTLKDFNSDTVFKGSNIPKNNIVYKVSDTLLHFGQFSSLPDSYIIIVNRYCLDTKEFYKFWIDFKRERYFILQDMVTGEEIFPLPSSTPPIYRFEIKFRPGQGRLFRIVELG